MNNWMDYAKAAADMAATLTKQYGPEAWETILWIQRIEAFSYLLPALLWVGAPFVWYRIVFCRLVPDAKRKVEELQKRSYIHGYEDVWQIYAIVFGSLVTGVLSIVSVIQLLSIWTWVQLFKPDLYLAKQLIDKVIN